MQTNNALLLMRGALQAPSAAPPPPYSNAVFFIFCTVVVLICATVWVKRRKPASMSATVVECFSPAVHGARAAAASVPIPTKQEEKWHKPAHLPGFSRVL